MSTLHEIDNPLGYLQTMVAHAAIDLIKRQRREAHIDAGALEWTGPPNEVFGGLEEDEIQRALDAARNYFEEVVFDAWFLKAHEAWADTDIGRELKLDRRTVHAHTQRVETFLRRFLGIK